MELLMDIHLCCAPCCARGRTLCRTRRCTHCCTHHCTHWRTHCCAPCCTRCCTCCTHCCARHRDIVAPIVAHVVAHWGRRGRSHPSVARVKYSRPLRPSIRPRAHPSRPSTHACRHTPIEFTSPPRIYQSAPMHPSSGFAAALFANYLL